MILKEIMLISNSVWQIFMGKQEKCQLVGEVQNTQLRKLLLKEKIDWIWISASTYFNHEVQFYMKPEHVVILPKSLVEYILRQPVRLDMYQDEIAMTIEGQASGERKEVMIFLKDFYLSHSMEIAYTRFETWQCNCSLHNRFANEVVELFQIYEEEIFNFFK